MITFDDHQEVNFRVHGIAYLKVSYKGHNGLTTHMPRQSSAPQLPMFLPQTTSLAIIGGLLETPLYIMPLQSVPPCTADANSSLRYCKQLKIKKCHFLLVASYAAPYAINEC